MIETEYSALQGHHYKGNPRLLRYRSRSCREGDEFKSRHNTAS